MSDADAPLDIDTMRDILADEGYRPWVDEDGDLLFKAEGITMLLRRDDGDLPFVAILVPAFWTVEGDEETAIADRLAAEVTAGMKVAKVMRFDDTLYASVELFVADPAHFRAILDTSLRALMVAVQGFVEDAVEAMPEAAARHGRSPRVTH